MLFWIFVIATGSAIGVLLGGGLLLWLRDQGLTVFNLLGTLALLGGCLLLLVLGWVYAHGLPT